MDYTGLRVFQEPVGIVHGCRADLCSWLRAVLGSFRRAFGWSVLPLIQQRTSGHCLYLSLLACSGEYAGVRYVENRIRRSPPLRYEYVLVLENNPVEVRASFEELPVAHHGPAEHMLVEHDVAYVIFLE